eukprot:11215400-Lingulodinium_polyedra.AAC.1
MLATCGTAFGSTVQPPWPPTHELTAPARRAERPFYQESMFYELYVDNKRFAKRQSNALPAAARKAHGLEPVQMAEA